MKCIQVVSAALLALSIGASAPASAMPQAAAPENGGLVTEVKVDCHPDVRRHYLPEYGRKVWHRHRQKNCKVVLADPVDNDRPRDCHREVERHYLPEYGRSVYHRHVGDSCRIKVYRPYEGSGPGGPNCVKLGPVLLCESY